MSSDFPAQKLNPFYDMNSTKLFRRVSDDPTVQKALSEMKTLVSERELNLQKDIQELRTGIEDAYEKLSRIAGDGDELRQENKKLAERISELEKKENLAFLLSRVTPVAHKELLSEGEMKERFLSNDECPTFVISIDIRRSTELMLKARTPESFARFMTALCDDLEKIVQNRFGVVDKFTGDGLLAFFPQFFTGADAAYFVITTAREAHRAFESRYKEYRTSFSTVLEDVGLGIGIDYGSVRLMRVAGGLTVVGTPVVYACRMGGAPAGRTYLNQPAYEKLSPKVISHCFIKETVLEIKHEGRILAYDVELTERQFNAQQPTWLKLPTV